MKVIFRKTKKITWLLISLIFIGAILRSVGAASNYKNWLKYTCDRGKLTKECVDEQTFFNLLASAKDSISGKLDESGQVKQEGALQTTSNLIAGLYRVPPASGVYYAYDVLHRLGVTPAYAQGVGFTGLQPILPIWKAFRNVTYILFTLVFIFMGLAIIFRFKISPQAVITIENALPKIVGALILVTFSYAIAGFMIDLMYVVIGLGIAILKPAIDQNLWQGILSGAALGAATGGPEGAVAGGAAGALPAAASAENVINWGFLSLVPPFALLVVQGGTFTALIGGVIGAALGTIVGTIAIPIPVIGSLIGGVAGGLGGAKAGAILGSLIFAIIAFFCLVKLFIALVKAYINVVLKIILGPFQIMLGALPVNFKGIGFGEWLKGLVTELAIFPAVIIVAFLGLIVSYSAISNNGGMWIAPLIGPPNVGPDTGVSGAIIKVVLGLGFLLTLSSLPDIIRKVMSSSSMFGAAVGQAFGPAKGMVGYGMVAASQPQVIDTALTRLSQKFPNAPFLRWWGSRTASDEVKTTITQGLSNMGQTAAKKLTG